MTEAKKVSQTLLNIMEHPITKIILNRSENVTDAVNTVQEWWGYDLFNRKPSSAYDEFGIFQGTDLDMACFLYEIATRGAVINIPVYKSMTKAKERVDEKIISKQNRHGKIIGIGANKNFFSFNIKILDQNVIRENIVGSPRTFSLTDYNGNWYDGWKELQFIPTLKENKFITENQLLTDNKIYFKNFVHPNRWVSFFGHYYLITKLMIERLEDETRYYNSLIKQMTEAGITFPKDEGPESHEYEYRESKQMKFKAFEVEIFIPECEIKGEYPKFEFNHINLALVYQYRKNLRSGLDRLRFMTRATEMAHYKNPNALPAWLQNINWEDDFKKPGGRIKWQRLKLFQTAVGEYSVSILKREYEKSQTVSVSY